VLLFSVPCPSSLAVVLFYTVDFALISSGFGCFLSLSFFHCVFDYCAVAWATAFGILSCGRRI